ncbi:DUF6311 domain-containing protein [uncultured Sphingomonas sp.]|uniref:DUF6311 domain-containing protein n=1 Tax=uncultured Sphingomonas sp. TaxID=158754 RepID=UPI0035C9527F
MRRAAFPLSIAALGLLVFLAWMHPAVLRPGNVGWLLTGDDRGQGAIGLAAYLRAGAWPGLREPLLSAPEGTALLFTDSIPLLALLLKPLAPLLPAAVQFVGPWYLLCALLQAGFAAALVRRHAPDPLAAWCGAALLTLSPVLLDRYGHPSLCAQWLLLWALWIFVEPRRAVRAGWWAAVLAAAALVHSYLLLMVLAIWSGALLEQAAGRERWQRLPVSCLALLPALGIMVAQGAFAGHYLATHSYGQFSAALDAWWNPANTSYTALLPASRAIDQRQAFEGLQYLGAGQLVLVALLVARLATGRLDPERRAVLRRLLWLAPAFLVLAMLAIGPALWWRSHLLAAAPLPTWIVDLLDPVRAAGRLMWPVTYTLAIAAILVAAGGRRGGLMLGAALALQVADLAPMLAAVRATSLRADDSSPFTRTLDPRWASLVAGASAVEFEPASYDNLPVMQELSWRAVLACRPVRSTYAAREAVATKARIAADARMFALGRIDPTRLYILPPGGVPAALRPRGRRLDGIALIPLSSPAPPPACATASSPRSAP